MKLFKKRLPNTSKFICNGPENRHEDVQQVSEKEAQEKKQRVCKVAGQELSELSGMLLDTVECENADGGNKRTFKTPARSQPDALYDAHGVYIGPGEIDPSALPKE